MSVASFAVAVPSPVLVALDMGRFVGRDNWRASEVRCDVAIREGERQ